MKFYFIFYKKVKQENKLKSKSILFTFIFIIEKKINFLLKKSLNNYIFYTLLDTNKVFT